MIKYPVIAGLCEEDERWWGRICSLQGWIWISAALKILLS